MINAPTPYVWIIGRTQTNGPADYDAVHVVQDGYTLTPLVAPPAPFVGDDGYDVTTEPVRKVNAMGAVEFLSYASNLLAVNPPHPTDFSILRGWRTWESRSANRLTRNGSPPIRSPSWRRAGRTRWRPSRRPLRHWATLSTGG